MNFEMIKRILNKIPRVIKNRKKLEEFLKVQITNRGKEVYIDGSPEDEYFAEKVIDALEFGFPYEVALRIRKDDLLFEIINIKDYAKSKDFARVRGRIIGTGGNALKTLSQITNCRFEIKDNEVGIIGNPEEILEAKNTIIFISQGSKHGNVYKSAIQKKNKNLKDDLGLKIKE